MMLGQQTKINKLTKYDYDTIYYHTCWKYERDISWFEFMPASYYKFLSVDRIHLFLFHSDGKIFKHGYCYENDIYSNGEIKSFEYLLEIKLHERIMF